MFKLFHALASVSLFKLASEYFMTVVVFGSFAFRYYKFQAHFVHLLPYPWNLPFLEVL